MTISKIHHAILRHVIRKKILCYGMTDGIYPTVVILNAGRSKLIRVSRDLILNLIILWSAVFF